MSMRKKGILLVAFGISTVSAKKALEAFEQQVQQAFPHRNIYWAFTSSAVRSQMKKNNENADSLHEALLKMSLENYSDVAIQSLHILAGIEYEAFVQEVKKYTKELSIMAEIGHPLLWEKEDINQVAEGLIAAIPEERLRGDAVLYAGHGTQHKQEKNYEILAQRVASKDSLTWIGTLEGKTRISELLPLLKKKKVKTVWLMPFLSLIGNHAQKDLWGEKKDSWKSLLEQEGFVCKPVVKGILESKGISIIWIEHLHKAIQSLDS